MGGLCDDDCVVNICFVSEIPKLYIKLSWRKIGNFKEFDFKMCLSKSNTNLWPENERWLQKTCIRILLSRNISVNANEMDFT